MQRRFHPLRVPRHGLEHPVPPHHRVPDNRVTRHQPGTRVNQRDTHRIQKHTDEVRPLQTRIQRPDIPADLVRVLGSLGLARNTPHPPHPPPPGRSRVARRECPPASRPTYNTACVSPPCSLRISTSPPGNAYASTPGLSLIAPFPTLLMIASQSPGPGEKSSISSVRCVPSRRAGSR